MISFVAAAEVSLYVRNAAAGTVAPDSKDAASSNAPVQAKMLPSSEKLDSAQAAAESVTVAGKPVDASILLAIQESQESEKKDANGLTKEEVEIVTELKKEDTAVRRHERAHATAAGPYGGMPSFEFVQGPDGKNYAVSGEVKIDASPGKSPEATIVKMEIVIRAALAPVDPSPQDRAVAAQAKQMMAQAQGALAEQKLNEQAGREDPMFKNKGSNLAKILQAYANTAKALASPTTTHTFGLSA